MNIGMQELFHDRADVVATRIVEEFEIELGKGWGLAEGGFNVRFYEQGAKGVADITLRVPITHAQFERIMAPVEEEK